MLGGIFMEVTPTPGAVDFSQVTTALTSSFTVSEVLGIVAIIVGAGSAFVLAWFGARKIIRAVQSALKNGKISF